MATPPSANAIELKRSEIKFAIAGRYRLTTGTRSGRFEAALGAATLSRVVVETDNTTEGALGSRRRLGGRLEPTLGILGGVNIDGDVPVGR
jgi:hypothetical protein